MPSYDPTTTGAAGGIMASEEFLSHQALAPVIQRQHAAQADYLQSRSALARQQLGVQQRMEQQLNRPRGGGDGTNPNPARDIAEMALNAGDFQTAIKAGTAASLIDYRQQAGETAQARTRYLRDRDSLTRLDLVGREFGGVTDEESYQAAAQRAGIKVTEPYSQEAVDRIRQRALTARDVIRLRQLDEDNKSKNRLRESKEKQLQLWADTDYWQRRSAAQSRNRVAKTDAPLVPLERETKAGADYIQNTYPAIDGAEARVKGRQLMENARAFKASNPALSNEDAMQKALSDMQGRGEFGILKPRTITKPGAPLPLPAKGAPITDLQEGKSYTDGQTTRTWLGPEKGWAESGNDVDLGLDDDPEVDDPEDEE